MILETKQGKKKAYADADFEAAQIVVDVARALILLRGRADVVGNALEIVAEGRALSSSSFAGIIRFSSSFSTSTIYYCNHLHH